MYKVTYPTSHKRFTGQNTIPSTCAGQPQQEHPYAEATQVAGQKKLKLHKTPFLQKETHPKSLKTLHWIMLHNAVERKLLL